MGWDTTLGELERRLSLIPEEFRDDGCSAPPFLKWLLNPLWTRLRPCCRVHDHWYCTRCWRAGELDQEHRHEADRFLGESCKAKLFPSFRVIGFWIFRAVDAVGGDMAYDSCGPDAGERCRHNMPMPDWMRG